MPNTLEIKAVVLANNFRISRQHYDKSLYRSYNGKVLHYAMRCLGSRTHLIVTMVFVEQPLALPCPGQLRYWTEISPGDHNPGDQNPDDQSSGDQNPGDCKSGVQNPGDQNPSDQNSGERFQKDSSEISREEPRPTLLLG